MKNLGIKFQTKHIYLVCIFCFILLLIYILFTINQYDNYSIEIESDNEILVEEVEYQEKISSEGLTLYSEDSQIYYYSYEYSFNESNQFSWYLEVINNMSSHLLNDDTYILLTIEVDNEFIVPDEYDLVTIDGITGIDITSFNGIINVEENIFYENCTVFIYFINIDYNDINKEIELFNLEFIIDYNQLNTVILSDNGGVDYIESKGEPFFGEDDGTEFFYLGNIATEDEGMYATLDNYGTSYYFRGAIENNYVEFAGMLWRIIRIDGEGNTKLIFYNSDLTATRYSGTALWNFSFNSIAEEAINSNYNDSEAKDGVDNWFNEYLSVYKSYLVESSYCIDMYIASSNRFATYNRLNLEYSPSLVCDTSIEGVSEYKYYAGLISADEAVFAGANWFVTNTEYYLATTFTHWTISSYGFGFTYSGAYVYTLGKADDGMYYANYTSMLYAEKVDYQYNAYLPTISLSSTVYYSGGEGTRDNPYTIIS